MAIIAFTNTNPSITPLNNFNEQVVVRLRVPDSGEYVIFGRLVIINEDGDPQNAGARLTTFDGVTELDKADVRLDSVSDGGSQAISLQATLHLPSHEANDVIDIRCGTFSGAARNATLFAISVDGLQGSL
jgi:hypothetical protein